MENEKKINFDLFTTFCKGCGICTKLCPMHAITPGEDGKPVMTDESKCVLCMMCEMRCPDFAIRIGRYE